MTKLYKKDKNGGFVAVGHEFTGFPANGVWIVKDGHNQCIHQFKEPIPTMPSPALLSYMILQDELTKKISEQWGKTPLSVADISKIACEFFAIKAGGMKFKDGILEN